MRARLDNEVAPGIQPHVIRTDAPGIQLEPLRPVADRGQQRISFALQVATQVITQRPVKDPYCPLPDQGNRQQQYQQQSATQAAADGIHVCRPTST